jgi:hypothetical protein
MLRARSRDANDLLEMPSTTNCGRGQPRIPFAQSTVDAYVRCCALNEVEVGISTHQQRSLS